MVVSPGAFVFVYSTPTELNVLEEWPGVQSVLMVESIRMVKPRGGITTEKRFFLSGLPSEDEQQIAAIRQHWSIENSLHWVLDVTFREDMSRVREQHARHNLAQRSKNRHQSDTPQYEYRQCLKQAKTSRLG
jgi:hypothetical protein